MCVCATSSRLISSHLSAAAANALLTLTNVTMYVPPGELQLYLGYAGLVGGATANAGGAGRNSSQQPAPQLSSYGHSLMSAWVAQHKVRQGVHGGALRRAW